jgi:hypothetical protein
MIEFWNKILREFLFVFQPLVFLSNQQVLIPSALHPMKNNTPGFSFGNRGQINKIKAKFFIFLQTPFILYAFSWYQSHVFLHPLVSDPAPCHQGDAATLGKPL